MNQHQFPPCFRAILFIRLNVPPRRDEVDEKASFCKGGQVRRWTSGKRGKCTGKGEDDKTYHRAQLHIRLPYFIPDTHRNLSTSSNSDQLTLCTALLGTGPTHILEHLDLAQQPFQLVVILPFHLVCRSRMRCARCCTSIRTLGIGARCAPPARRCRGVRVGVI